MDNIFNKEMEVKIKPDLNKEDIENYLSKAKELVETLEKANTLVDELASLKTQLNISIN